MSQQGSIQELMNLSMTNINCSPAEWKARKAIQAAYERLPFRVAMRISSISFGPDGVLDPAFEVRYCGGKAIIFDNIDEFPTEADIAHICVNCPG